MLIKYAVYDDTMVDEIYNNRSIHRLLGVGSDYNELQLSLSSLPASVMVNIRGPRGSV